MSTPQPVPPENVRAVYVDPDGREIEVPVETVYTGVHAGLHVWQAVLRLGARPRGLRIDVMPGRSRVTVGWQVGPDGDAAAAARAAEVVADLDELEPAAACDAIEEGIVAALAAGDVEAVPYLLDLMRRYDRRRAWRIRRDMIRQLILGSGPDDSPTKGR